VQSVEAVANGHIVASTSRQTDVETNVLHTTPNRISSPLISLLKGTEKSDVTNDEEVIPVIITDTSDTDSVQQHEDMTTENISPSSSQSRSKIRDVTGHQEVVSVMVKDVTVEQNEDVTVATSSRSVYRKKAEKSTGNRPQEVVQNDIITADDVRQNGDVSNLDKSGRLIYKKKSAKTNENRHQEVVPVVIKDSSFEADAVWQNGTTAAQVKKQGTFTKRREQETQVKSLHIEDDGDDDDDDDDADVIEERKPLAAQNSVEGQASGAEMFASTRPHAWHQELAKKRHETALHEQPLDRQVLLVAFLHQIRLLCLCSICRRSVVNVVVDFCSNSGQFLGISYSQCS